MGTIIAARSCPHPAALECRASIGNAMPSLGVGDPAVPEVRAIRDGAAKDTRGCAGALLATAGDGRQTVSRWRY